MAGTASQQVTAGGASGEEVRLVFAMASPNASEFARKPWYWGVISRSECESILNNLAISGEFIIRDSESHVSGWPSYAISPCISILLDNASKVE